MTKVEIEKLIYKKPRLVLGLDSLSNINKLTGEDDTDIPVEDGGDDEIEPSIGSAGTGGNG